MPQSRVYTLSLLSVFKRLSIGARRGRTREVGLCALVGFTSLEFAGCGTAGDSGDERSSAGEASSGDASSSGGETGETGETEGATGTTGTTGTPVTSHEGEPCTKDEEAQICLNGSQMGFEVCNGHETLLGTPEYVWSQCIVETCDVADATRPCTTEEGLPGIERCFAIKGVTPPLWWGSCAVDACVPGTLQCDKGRRCRVDAVGVAYWGRPYPSSEFGDECSTPLVLAFDGQEPTYRPAPTTAAAFAISGPESCASHDWPTEATPWLVRDLDRSGDIEAGHELFGSGTMLADGRRARHGFEALAELDADGDRAITPRDPTWSELLVWADANGDRRASGWELLPLAAYGVESLGLNFDVAPVCDARGNCGRERSTFTFRHDGATSHGQLVDVYLVCE